MKDKVECVDSASRLRNQSCNYTLVVLQMRRYPVHFEFNVSSLEVVLALASWDGYPA